MREARKATRQIARKMIFERAFADVSREYAGMPRDSRRRIARSIAKAMRAALIEAQKGQA